MIKYVKLHLGDNFELKNTLEEKLVKENIPITELAKQLMKISVYYIEKPKDYQKFLRKSLILVENILNISSQRDKEDLKKLASIKG